MRVIHLLVCPGLTRAGNFPVASGDIGGVKAGEGALDGHAQQFRMVDAQDRIRGGVETGKNQAAIFLQGEHVHPKRQQFDDLAEF